MMLEQTLIRPFVITFAVVSGSCGEETDGIDFTELAKVAEYYELPLPPEKASLVLAKTGWTTVVGSSSTSHDPGIYRPAFLLEKLPQGQARVLMGWQETVVDSDAEHCPATRPYSLVPQKPVLKGYVLACGNMSSFTTAVQLAQLGRLREAEGLWERIESVEYFSDENALEGVGRWTKEPRVLLARCLYQHFYEALLHEDADLKAIHQKLVQLKREYPVLFSDDRNEYYPHRRTRFVHDLGLTVAAKKAREGSVEALLIDWGNRTGDMRHLGIFDEHNIVADQPALAIFRMGVTAIPELAELVNDQRLTRHISPAFMKKPEERVRLGQLAERLLKRMAGSQDPGKAGSIGQTRGSEREFFERAAVDLEDATISRFHEVPLWILGEKYPRSLVNICSKIPSKASADVPLFALTETIARSKLTREEKAEALAGLCERLGDASRQRAVLQQLAKVNEQRCVTLLGPILNTLPNDVDEPYWTCEAASYTHVVMQLQDDGIWKDYLKVAKRAAVGLRMEMMNSMNYSYIGQKNWERRLAFLAAFLDDTTVRDPSINEAKYDGPCAAFTLGKIEVRDFAAMKVASILDVGDWPTEFWTKDQWAQLRRQVLIALKEVELPKLAE